VEERLDRLEARVESLQPEKDIFDKIESVSGLVTGGVVVVLGVVVSRYYENKQRRAEEARHQRQQVAEEQHRERDAQIQRIQTLGAFMPHLMSHDEKATEVSLLAIEALGDTKLATRLGELLRTAGAVTALSRIATSSDPEAAQRANESLLTIFDDFVAGAQAYELIRESVEPGPERTLAMTRLVEGAKARARQHPLSSRDLSNLFARGDGGRVAALAVLQSNPLPEFFPQVKDAVANSKSAFEQYEALRALEAMLSEIQDEQRREIRKIITDQRSGEPGKHIRPDSDRWPLSQRILDRIDRLSNSA
jgi:hypothetical protein